MSFLGRFLIKSAIIAGVFSFNCLMPNTGFGEPAAARVGAVSTDTAHQSAAVNRASSAETGKAHENAEKGSQDIRVIPYPPGLNISQGTASSAPQEINHKFSSYFVKHDFYDIPDVSGRVLIKKYPVYQQTKDNTSGPAACLTVLYYYGNRDFTEMSLAGEMKVQDSTHGANPKDMVEFYRTLGWEVESSLDGKSFARYDDFKAFVLKKLQAGTPIMVEDIEWGGHWRVIIGYDTIGTESTLDDVLILADSNDLADHFRDGYTVENGQKFFSGWFAGPDTPEDQRLQPWITAHPRAMNPHGLESAPDSQPYISAFEQETKVSRILSTTAVSKKTDQILLLMGHNLSLWNKSDDGSWSLIIETYCGYGKNGLSENKREGDGKTPIGAFPILYAFGTADNPETSLEYKKITPNSYLSGERDGTYNTWVESPIRLENSKHLADSDEYRYALHIGYNSNPAEYSMGSAVFLHVKGQDDWSTDGSLSVPDLMMRRILKNTHEGAYVLIVPQFGDISRY